MGSACGPEQSCDTGGGRTQGRNEIVRYFADLFRGKLVRKLSHAVTLQKKLSTDSGAGCCRSGPS